MIFFPVPDNEVFFSNLKKSPVCIAVTLVLIVCFFASRPFDQNSLMYLPEQEKEVFWEVQGDAYIKYLREENVEVSSLLSKLLQSSKESSRSKTIVGYLSLRDPYFSSYAEWYAKKGDLVKFQIWKQVQQERNQSIFERILLKYGINQESFSELTVVTYMFLHASLGHLLANVFFLLLFGVVIERRFGSLMFTTVFTLGGIMGAFFYFSLNGLSMVSLIGASGSVSALVAFYSFYMLNERMSFFYFLFPADGYFGMIQLPAVGTIIWWSVYEYAHYISSAGVYGSVAHSAHLGGFVLGVLTASLLRLIQCFLEGQEKIPVEPNSPSSL